MNRKFIAAIAIAAGSVFTGLAKDEVVMTVNGNDVSRSEFEYLYHKNQQQQVDPQTLEEYAEMFKIYKLKVADALDQRLDTLPAFIREMEQYKKDLARPYMTDSVYLNSLVKEAYDRSRDEVEAFHIMLLKGNTPAEKRNSRMKADSIRAALLGGADFADLAARFSVDKGSGRNGGRMGYITEGRFPYSFEKAAFSLQPGEISEIVESQQGFHILKGGNRRPARGTVLTEHIMKMVRPDATPEQEAAAKASIDSIYAVVKADPEKFEDLARELSDDKGSGRTGGKLNWFGAGMMVEPFDSAAFAIAVGEISAPVRSQYGWHIIRKLDAKDPASLEEMKPLVLKRAASDQDERSRLVYENMIANLARKHRGRLNDRNIDQICEGVITTGLDSAWFEGVKSNFSLGAMEVARIGKRVYSLADWVAETSPVNIPDKEFACEYLRSSIESSFGRHLVEAEEDWLYENEPDYSNLLNEYREGSLLYEASLRRVWDKASKDTEGLEDYFRMHRADYSWQQPHVKALLVQAADDSIADAVKTRLAAMQDNSELKGIRKDFAGKVAVEPILLEKGQNPMVDYLAFGGAPVQPSNKKYTVCFLWDSKILNAPETMSDVKSLVVSDYQNKLESDWIESLKEKYPVKVNKKVLKKIK